jgi:hypothetical protein
MFYHLLARQIALVTNKKLVDSLDRVTVDLLQPLLDVGEGVYHARCHINFVQKYLANVAIAHRYQLRRKQR